jgi:hypothetical protein
MNRNALNKLKFKAKKAYSLEKKRKKIKNNLLIRFSCEQ